MKFSTAACITAVMIILHSLVYAQETAVFTDVDAKYKEAVFLFQQEKFESARKLFSACAEEWKHDTPEHYMLAMDAQYYEGLCCKFLNRPDAEKLFVDLTINHDTVPIVKRAFFQLGNLYFDEKKYDLSLNSYVNSDSANMEPGEKSEYIFKTGYCYFYKKQFDKAAAYFNVIRKSKNEYYYPANYYYGYAMYKKGKLDEAKKSFAVVESSQLYQSLVPYYLMNIAFMQGDYDDVIQQGKNLQQNNQAFYQNEIQQLIGKAYFQKQQYDQALPYLKAYASSNTRLNASDQYELAYCEFKSSDYENAIKNLQPLTSHHDSIGQNAYYLLGNCYLQTNQKDDALLAFEQAAKPKHDATVKEQSSFQYAKLTFDLNRHDVAVKALQQFITEYPKADETDEARKMLSEEFAQSNNYDGALQIIRSIKNITPELRASWQRMAYSRGAQLYNDGKNTEADQLFDESLKNPVDKSIQAACYFWKGEIDYDQKDYKTAVSDLQQFRTIASGVKALPDGISMNYANYTLGYCYLNLNQYDQAGNYFTEVKNYFSSQKNSDDQSKSIYTDALLRKADCDFVSKNYGAASTGYREIAQTGTNGSDYALYQTAILQGLNGKTNDKISSLQKLTSTNSSSLYADDAWYELGITYLGTQSYSDAANAFNQLITKYPSSPFVKSAHLKLGLIDVNTNNDDDALQQYKWVLQKYPHSPEATEALNGVKEIYSSQGNASGYLDFLKSMPNVSVSESSKDSVLFAGAQNLYQKGDFGEAISAFDNYLQANPNGIFAADAHFYRGDCLMRADKTDDALNDFEFVISKQPGKFTEKSLLYAGRISYDKKDYRTAYDHFQQLALNADYQSSQKEAWKGMMFCAFSLSQFDDCKKQANNILANHPTADDAEQANYYLAKVALAGNDYATAMNGFQKLMKSKGVIGAEAYYQVAWIDYLQNDFKGASKQCNMALKQAPKYDYWTAKTYLLLAFIFDATNDDFQAKATLQSLLDNYKGNDDILPAAQKKLDEINSKPGAQSNADSKSDSIPQKNP